MKNFLLFSFFSFCLIAGVYCTGFDIKTSSIIDQPTIEVLGDYNNSWYAIAFEKPNHPEHPARFYILKFAAGFPTAKSSPVYPPFGEKTDYLKSAIINNKICVFYSRTEHLAERPNMVDARDGYKQIPQIMRQDYDPVTLLPSGEPVSVFDETKEHFAASGIEIAQSEDKSKTAILIKHYFRQSRFKVVLIDNNRGLLFERSYDLKTEKDLVNFRQMTVNNDGQILLEAKMQEDPLHIDAKGKRGPRYYFFSILNKTEDLQMLSLAPSIGGNQSANEPIISWLNNGELVISYDHYANEHSPVLKGISVTKYKTDFSITGTQDIVPNDKIVGLASTYQKTKDGLEYLETRKILPLDGGTFVLIAEYRRSTETKDKVTGAVTTLLERHYMVAYRLDEMMSIKCSTLVDKKQSTHTVAYAFSLQAYRQGNDVFLLHNEDCDGDGEHGLSLLSTKLSATGGEPVTQKIAHTSEDFFTSMEHIYTGNGNRILFTEEKVVDFSAEARELKLLEIHLK